MLAGRENNVSGPFTREREGEVEGEREREREEEDRH